MDYKTAIEVFAYLETHSIDPDNSLCGLEPSRDVIRSSQRELEELSQKDSSREVLINKIISWGENLTSKVSINETQLYSAFLSQNKKKGS